MKKPILFLLSLIVLFFVYACDDDAENPNEFLPDPVTPDLAVKINASVSGFVVDDAGKPVAYATVTAGGKTVETDDYGYFRVSDAPLAAIAGSVKVTMAGYFDGYRTFLPSKDEETFVRLQLVTKFHAGTIAATGGSLVTSSGGKITLGSLVTVNASNGELYTGAVHVYTGLIETASGDNLSDAALNSPGDARGTNSDGYLSALKSFGMVAVELMSANGQRLQIAKGKSATISIPIRSELKDQAPASMSLWSFDETAGLWKQEADATRDGDVYTGTVNHFSYWESAVGIPLVDFTARIVDASGQPLVHVPVSITPAGASMNAGYSRFAYTDADGYVRGAVFANSDLVLDINTPCALSAYSHAFTAGATAVDLGQLTGNLGQGSVTITGTATNCGNQPIASGYVQTYDHGFYNRIPVVNGNFSFTGVMCTNTAVNIVVVDNATFFQSEPKGVTINPGSNDLGALQVCDESTLGSITYTIDDGPEQQVLEPADTIAIYNLGVANGVERSQFIVISGDPNGAPKLTFQFDGGKTIGSEHKFTDIYSALFFTSGRGWWPETDNGGVPVTITEYGDVGGFVSGSFSHMILDFDTNTPHTYTVNFRVRRYQ